MRLTGLNDIMADICSQGRKANDNTAEEIIKRLEEKNYIPSSPKARREYSYALMREYRKYIKEQSDKI